MFSFDVRYLLSANLLGQLATMRSDLSKFLRELDIVHQLGVLTNAGVDNVMDLLDADLLPDAELLKV